MHNSPGPELPNTYVTNPPPSKDCVSYQLISPSLAERFVGSIQVGPGRTGHGPGAISTQEFPAVNQPVRAHSSLCAHVHRGHTGIWIIWLWSHSDMDNTVMVTQ